VLERSFCMCCSIVGTSLYVVSGGGAVPVFGDICYFALMFYCGNFDNFGEGWNCARNLL
jgi:hypothetical protein